MKITNIIPDPPGKINLYKKSQGLGDSIKVITDTLRIPQCGACKRRQQKLNRLFPYKKKS